MKAVYFDGFIMMHAFILISFTFIMIKLNHIIYNVYNYLNRCLKCERVPNSLVDRFLDTLADRCRLPGITGGGAVKVDLELATPLIVIPTSLVLASSGPISTVIVLLFLPVFCAFFYKTWKRRTNKKRTKFFFVWGLISLVFMYLLFEIIICVNTRVTYVENLILTVCLIGLLITLKFVKDDPGILVKSQINRYLQDSYSVFGFDSQANVQTETEEEGFEIVNVEDLDQG